jgi:dolichol-phosphate mannosyltransferase
MDNQPHPESAPLKLLSVVIPARDEEGCIASTVRNLHAELQREGIPHQIVVVDDGSTDGTQQILTDLTADVPELSPIRSGPPHGFGRAVVAGFEHSTGDAIVIMMADESDDCRDAVTYWRTLNDGWDCVFGSRFIRGGKVTDYPLVKRAVNRLVNRVLMPLFGIRLNDTTNAFKAYRRTVLEGCRPFLSPHFNLTVELPLKAITRGYSWTVVPISWKNRRTGTAKLKLTEMGSRYFFIVMYVWLEKYFSRGDYRRPDPKPAVADAQSGHPAVRPPL